MYLRRPDFSIRRCKVCSVMWCDPLRFDASFNPDNEDAYLEVDDAIAAENAGRVSFTRAHAPASSHARMVEIGCMHGDFVEQARAGGYDARLPKGAQDFSAATVGKLAEALGYEVIDPKWR